jgi:hypothetical protein
MLELRDYARSGPLQGFFSDAPFWFRPENGVIGVALSYDEDLVREVNYATFSSFPRDTVQHAAVVAQVLAGITSTWRFRGPSTERSTVRDEYGVFLRWMAASYRRYERPVTPVVIEVTVGPDFPREGEPSSLNAFFEEHRIVYRRAKRSTLHYAESGGRFICEGPWRWGTLGGFLETLNSRLYATSAAHVVNGNRFVVGTPAFRGAQSHTIRSALQKTAILGKLSSRWMREEGSQFDVSPPVIVSRYQCSVSSNPTLPGLDVALAEWPTESTRIRTPVEIGAPGQISQVLPSSFLGAASGLQRVYVSSLSIWHSYELPDSDQTACVSDVLQIKLRDRPYARSNVSRGGDSGAWIIAEGVNGPVWLGLLVGGDGDRAAVVPASRIVSHFEGTLGPLYARLS